MKRRYRFPLTLLLAIALSLAMSTAAFADTDGTEPKIVQQPDQLVLQLGTRWAGVEFELRTDAGIFPAPVVVDENGVLTMDLGGSTTYTLSCINSTAPIPDPGPEQSDPSPSVSPDPTPEVPSSPQPETGNNSLPLPAVIFLVGLAVAGGAFIALHITKKRQAYGYDEWEDDEDEP
ncbi:MAG: DUF4366 domain-containing protein [Oscillospiraceae bacterium]|jgi:hypothetical protein|nr:DUF4366 domain-containing protein [Oscillospiraceae bacterium]